MPNKLTDTLISIAGAVIGTIAFLVSCLCVPLVWLAFEINYLIFGRAK